MCLAPYRMREKDLADSPLASHSDLPSNHCDSLRDLLAEPFQAYRGELPADHSRFRVICLGLLDAGLIEAEDAGATEQSAPVAAKAALVKVLQLLAGDSDRRLAVRALCYLRLIGVDGRSFEAIGAPYGLCRAAVQTVYRQIQRCHPGMRSRGDKSDAAREACRRRRMGARKPRIDWPTGSLWNNPLPLPH